MSVSGEKLCKKKAILILILFSTACLIRLYFLPTPGHGTDMAFHKRWFNAIDQHGILKIYEKTDLRFPPLWTILMGGNVALKNLFPEETNIIYFLKLPGVLADMIIGLILLLYLKKNQGYNLAIIGAGLYLLNPGVIYLSAYWGKWGAVAGLFTILTLLFAYNKKPELSWIFFSLGVLTKLQVLVIGPLLLVNTLRFNHPKKVVYSLILSLLTFMIVLSPFLISGQGEEIYFWVWEKSLNIRPIATGNAYNTWRLITIVKGIDIDDTNWFLGLNDQDIVYNSLLFGPIDYHKVGVGLFSIAYLLTLIYLFSAKSRKSIFLAAFFIEFSFFMLPTRIYDRYLFYALSVAALIITSNRKVFSCYLVLSVTYFLNLVHVLSSDYGYWGAHLFAGIDNEVLILCLVNLAAFIYASHYMTQLAWSNTRPYLENHLTRKALIIIIVFISLMFAPNPNFCNSEEGVLYLSDLLPVSARQGWGVLTYAGSVGDNSLFINGEYFCRGLGTHSHSEIVYDLRGLKASRFVSFVGVDDEVQYGSVVFQVYGDGKLLAETRLLKKGMGPDSIIASVENVSELKLVVTDGGDRGGYGDHANWADAKLVGPEYLVKAKTDMGSGNLIASRIIVLLPLIFLFNIFHTILYKLNLDGKKIIAILLLLSLLVFQCVLSMGYKNPTYDEPGHIGGGYAYIAEGEFRLGGLSSMEHPPLVRSIGAFPLLFIDGLKFSRDSVDWYKTSHWTLGNRLLYGDYEKTGQAIFLTRLAIILLSVLLAAYVFTWATKLFGFKAGFFSLFLYVLNPNILAHSQLVTTDLGGTCFMFIAVYYLWVNARNPSALNLFLSQLSFGLALVSKISALMLVPVYLIMVFAYSIKESSSTKNFLKKYVSRILILIVSALLVINLAYGLQGTLRPLKSYQLLSPIGRILQVTPLNDILVPLPYAYVLGMDYGMYHSARGHPTFFLGKVMGSGFWFYYPLVFLIKNPIPLLLFLLIATIQHFRKKTNILDILFIVIPVFVYFIILSQGNVNIGLRHALPTFPLLFVYASRIVSELDRRILYTLCIIYIYSSLSIYPHYISYFNAFAGGADKGYRFVVVSDLDWGQDMLGLAGYVNENNITNLYYSKYNTADPGYYGLSYKPLECGEQSGVIAIHVANLLRDTECNGWLLNQTPYKKIGYSIFLYNITG